MNVERKLSFCHFISFGHFCSIAEEIERIGRRDASDPFDWVITDIRTVQELLKNSFEGLFEEESLHKDTQHNYIVHHRNYRFDFYHDFIPEQEIKDQIAGVKEKYNRRIERFYKRIEEPTLFLRYITIDEIEYWYHDAKDLIKWIKGYNKENSVVLISPRNTVIDESRVVTGVIKILTDTTENKNPLSACFIRNNKPIRNFFSTIDYPVKKAIFNYIPYYKKAIKRILKKFIFSL
jgi:hypothetical protein